MISDSTNFKTTFPILFEKIRTYANMDKDFKRICVEFEELSELISVLEKSDQNNLSRMEINKYKQLQQTLISEIKNFMQEEK